MKATEEYEREIIVQKAFNEQWFSENVESIREAIDYIKENRENFDSCRKIKLDGEVVFSTDKHNSIEDWENIWKKEKRRMSFSDEAYECPHDVVGCVSDDLCIDCQIDKAKNIDQRND
jgi:hypothetical protein